MKFYNAVALAFCVAPFALTAQTVISGVRVAHRPVGGMVGTAVAGSSVQNAPYSADVVTETDRVLPDGNRHQEQHGRMARDSKGRMRQEHEIPGAGANARFVVISDPVQQRIVTLNPGDNTARVIDLSVTGKQPAAGTSTTPQQTPLAAHAQPASQPTPSVKTEDVGEKEIDGIMVKGTRTTITTPAGAIGNEREIVATSETWVSPELDVVVLTTSSDPQYGTTTHKLQNIQRGDPDPALFQVPADYTVQNESPDYVVDKQVR